MTDDSAQKDLESTRRELHSAVRSLYQIFRRKRHGDRPWADIDFPTEKRSLPERLTVDELEEHDYQHLAWHAFCWDRSDPDTVKYFLPRLADNFSRGDTAPLPVELLVAGMRSAHWRSWPDVERAAVERFFWALCQSSIVAGVMDLGETASLIAFSGMSLAPLFDTWRRVTTLPAALEVAAFIEAVTRATRRRFLDRWKEVWQEGVDLEAIRSVWDFVADPAVGTKLEDAFFLTNDAKEQSMLSVAEAQAAMFRLYDRENL